MADPPYLRQVYQLDDETAALLELFDELHEELGIDPTPEHQAELGQAIAFCTRSAREARERWETQTMPADATASPTTKSDARSDC